MRNLWHETLALDYFGARLLQSQLYLLVLHQIHGTQTQVQGKGRQVVMSPNQIQEQLRCLNLSVYLIIQKTAFTTCIIHYEARDQQPLKFAEKTAKLMRFIPPVQTSM